MTTMEWKNIKEIICNKAKIILIIGLVCALCAAGVKYLFTPDITLKGDFIYSRIIKIEDANKSGFNYAGALTGNTSYLAFVKAADKNTFDYSKVYSNWNRIDDAKKVEWLRRSIRMKNYKNNTYEISYLIPSSNISDLPYLEKNAAGWMEGFISQGEKMIKKARPRAKIRTVKSACISPEVIKNDKSSIILRNAVYGFIAGIFLSAAVLVGIPFYKQI